MDPLCYYREVWLADFEFRQPDGDRPEPLCMVAREYRSGHTYRLWADDLTVLPSPPFGIGDDTLFVAYYASAELGSFYALDWPMPVRILDLFAEFRCATNGASTLCGDSLLGALVHYGLDGIDVAEKAAMRELAMRGGPYTATERADLLNYCESDVIALAKLLPAMLPQIDLPRALLRGRYMAAAARIERTGIPIDTEMLATLRGNWTGIKDRLIRTIDRDYGVFVPKSCGRIKAKSAGVRAGLGLDEVAARSDESDTKSEIDASVRLAFCTDRFANWLVRKGIPWPRLDSGRLDLDDDTFRQMSRVYPAVAPLRQLRQTLDTMRLFEDLTVGSDGRNRCLLSAFRSITGRNQPSNAEFIFGPSCWLRGLIRPEVGRAIAYVDWSQQEFGIAAALSGDLAMQEAYLSGDPYLAFAKQARAVPADATKSSHRAEREQFKVCALAVQYRMGAKSLALALGKSEAHARELLYLHRQTYPVYWAWSQLMLDHAVLSGQIETVFGWPARIGKRANPCSLANFPMQANGAEMLRLACCLATERGITVCAPIQDALLIEASQIRIEEVVSETQAAMAEASRIVLEGFELRSDTKIVQHPARYMDPRGERMWNTVMGILAEL